MTQEEQVLIELLNCNAISENAGLTASEVSELVTHKKANARLSSLRQKGYVKSSNNSRPISVYWLSKEGVELASEIKTKQDQSTDANLSTANNTSENTGLTDATLIDDATSQANSDDDCLNCTQESCGSCDEAKPIPQPQYNPEDVAFKKSDTVFWYTVNGIDEVFETSSDAIAAAHDYVATHRLSTQVHAIASKPHAIIKPVVTTELEYL
jgi:hypothetical protein